MDAIAESLRQVLRGRYDVESEIGHGGMAVVFLAHDIRHDRRVALKVMLPELSASLGAQRFAREIRLAAGLQHPHILPVYDSGEAGGLIYYAMPYVEGESLRARIVREGQLPLGDSLRIAQEVADALHYAHAHDVVHRDIKPENIMLSGDHALVMDFGIARAVNAAGGRKLTETGLALGTPAYMSPEQVSADPRVDGRTDIYALGCVLYEMLAGTPPFVAASAHIVMARHSIDTAPPLKRLRPTVPDTVEETIMKALAKAPSDRFPTAEAFGKSLMLGSPNMGVTRDRFQPRRAFIVVAAASLGLAGLLTWTIFRPTDSRDASAEPATIAIAPMRNLGDTSDAYFADGLAREITNALTRVRGIAPRPYASVAVAAEKQPNPLALGRQLGVEYVLAATIRRQRDELRVTSELIRVKDGSAVWSPHSFSDSGADVFRMQDSITSNLVRELAGRFSGDVGGLSGGRGRGDTKAYELYLQALHVPGVSASGSQQRVTLLTQAVERDPSFADAWTALASAYGSLSQYSGEAPVDILRQRIDAIDRAIGLDSLNGDAWAQRAGIRLETDWNFVEADRGYRKALELTPASAWIHSDYSQLLDVLMLEDSAIAEIRRAIRYDPTESHYAAILGYYLLRSGRLYAADTAIDRALQLNKNNWVAYVMRAKLAFLRGRPREAVQEAERAQAIQGPTDPFSLSLLGHAYGRAGQLNKAQVVLSKITEMARRRYVEHSWLALARLGVGDRDGAVDELNSAANVRDVDFLLALIESRDELRDDPRYRVLLRRANLNGYWESADRRITARH
jgi:eukaryotic-like serine/threonine-protein kinase